MTTVTPEGLPTAAEGMDCSDLMLQTAERLLRKFGGLAVADSNGFSYVPPGEIYVPGVGTTKVGHPLQKGE